MIRKIVVVMVATWLLSSCNKWVFDNLDHCPRGVRIELYSQTECANEPSYPAEVKQVMLFLFDENGTLAALHEERGLTLAKGKEIEVALPREGAYKAVAWAGIDPQLFTTASFTIGKTTITELYTTLKDDADLKGHTLWQGATERDILLTPLKEGETEQYVHTKINLREITNRVTIIVEGLEHPEAIEMTVESANSEYLHNGAIRYQSPLHSYPLDIALTPNSYDKSQTPPNEVDQFNGTYTATFTTLRLESGRNSRVNIKSKAIDKILNAQEYQRDLIGLIHLAQKKSNGEVNLHCQNDFVVQLKVKRCRNCSDGYMIAEITINNWCVHSVDIELGV